MKYLLPILFVSLVACNRADIQQELSTTQQKLKQAEAALALYERQAPTKIVHNLYFSLKAEATPANKSTLIDLLHELGKLPYVQEIHLGTPADVADPRNRTDYGVAMQMRFASIDQLNAYQQDSTHLAIRAQAAPLLGGPPVVYDVELVD